MANIRLAPLIHRLGFCCIFAFIRSVRGRSHDRVAEATGLHRNTIRAWRRRVKLRECRCEGRETCAKKQWHGTYRDEVPRIELRVLGNGKDPFSS